MTLSSRLMCTRTASDRLACASSATCFAVARVRPSSARRTRASSALSVLGCRCSSSRSTATSARAWSLCVSTDAYSPSVIENTPRHQSGHAGQHDQIDIGPAAAHSRHQRDIGHQSVPSRRTPPAAATRQICPGGRVRSCRPSLITAHQPRPRDHGRRAHQAKSTIACPMLTGPLFEVTVCFVYGDLRTTASPWSSVRGL
jgi:hypothetical protein